MTGTHRKLNTGWNRDRETSKVVQSVFKRSDMNSTKWDGIRRPFSDIRDSHTKAQGEGGSCPWGEPQLENQEMKLKTKDGQYRE